MLNKLKRDFIDLGGIISTFFLIIQGLTFLYNYLSEHNLFNYYTVLPIILMIIVSLFSQINRLKQIKENIESTINTQTINKSIEEYTKKSISTPFEEILPSDTLINAFIHILEQKVEDWDKNARLMSESLSIDFDKDSISVMFYRDYESSWKKETLSVGVGEHELYEIKEENTIFTYHYQIESFHKFYPNWRKAVLMAYKSIEGKLPLNYKFMIFQHLFNTKENITKLSFIFVYKQGSIARKASFQYDGRRLVNESDGNSMPIK